MLIYSTWWKVLGWILLTANLFWGIRCLSDGLWIPGIFSTVVGLILLWTRIRDFQKPKVKGLINE